ncbi:hypothetical protein [Desulfobacula sp.]|uniref:hypothetical protein n=1 Tax=Desulfobacula sp. TaxID=2593537 RepID=UPI00260F41EE|nr:hypothetical protein [Desulfobacula sp.]
MSIEGGITSHYSKLITHYFHINLTRQEKRCKGGTRLMIFNAFTNTNDIKYGCNEKKDLTFKLNDDFIPKSTKACIFKLLLEAVHEILCLFINQVFFNILSGAFSSASPALLQWASALHQNGEVVNGMGKLNVT